MEKLKQRNAQGFTDINNVEINGVKIENFLIEKTKELIERVKSKNVNCIFFLDKSARPLAHYFLRIWNKTQKTRPPKIKFINIGREDKSSFVSKRDREYISLIKKDLNNVGQRVIIVDEFSDSADDRDSETKKSVEHFFGLTFPKLQTEFFTFLRRNKLMDSCGGNLDLYSDALRKIFPWFKNKDEFLLIDDKVDRENSDGDYLIEYFTKPVSRLVDRTHGLQLRKNIKDKIKKFFKEKD